MPLTAGLMVHAPMSGGSAPFTPDFYVSPTGSSSNNGSIGSPWSLTYALAGAGGAITAGKQVALRGGTYSAINFGCLLNGTAGSRIVFRNYPGEWPKIEIVNLSGGNTWDGTYLDLWGCEIYYPGWTTRKSAGPDDGFPPDMPLGAEFRWRGNNNRLIYCIIHDIIQINYQAAGGLNRIYGCLSYNNGWEGATVRGFAHGAYMQNWSSPRQRKYFENNVLFGNFGNQFQLFTESNSNFDSTLTGNVLFLGGNVTTITDDGLDLLVVLGGSDTSGLVVEDNCCFVNTDNVNLEAQFFETLSAGNVGNDASIRNNIFMGKLSVKGWGNGAVTFTGNKIYGPRQILLELRNAPSPYTLYTWNANEWHSLNEAVSNSYTIVGTPFLTFDFPGWKTETAWDATSTYSLETAFTGKQTLARAVNEFETSRGYFIVYNWDGDSSVTMPASEVGKVLTAGDSYDLREAQALTTSALTGTWNGSSGIALPMTAVTPPSYLGGNQVTPLPTTGTKFHCFVLRKQGNWEF